MPLLAKSNEGGKTDRILLTADDEGNALRCVLTGISDLSTEEAHKDGWVDTAQHAGSLMALNSRGICDPEIFAERVSFRFADMRNLPDDLGTFDFIWSSCSGAYPVCPK